MGLKQHAIYGKHEFKETIPLKSGLRLTPYDTAELERQKTTKDNHLIIILSVVSVFFNMALAVTAFIIAAMRDSAATYAFGADCLLDLVSSSILLWRFFGNDTIDVYAKERKACICLGGLFVTAALAVIVKASIDIVQQDHPVTFRALYILSICGTIICFIMASVKYWLARRANSASLMLDAVNSVISGLLALVIIVSDLIYRMNIQIWFLDPMFSIVLSVVLVFYGLKVIYDHREKNLGPL